MFKRRSCIFERIMFGKASSMVVWEYTYIPNFHGAENVCLIYCMFWCFCIVVGCGVVHWCPRHSLDRGRGPLTNSSQPAPAVFGLIFNRFFLSGKGGYPPPPLSGWRLAKNSLKTAFFAQKTLVLGQFLTDFFLSGKGGEPPPLPLSGRRLAKKLAEKS